MLMTLLVDISHRDTESQSFFILSVSVALWQKFRINTQRETTIQNKVR